MNIGTLSRKDELYSPRIDTDRIPHTRFRLKRHLILDYVSFVQSDMSETFLYINGQFLMV